ncbi:MAG: hypothetical protein ACE5FO_05135 [Parvularculaceae bacterium]
MGMKAGEKKQGALKSAFDAVRARIGFGPRRAGAGESNAPVFPPPPDPAQTMDAVVEARMRQAADDAALSIRLEESARAIIERRAGLRDRARAVSASVADRQAGEVSLFAQSLRFLIGLGWLGIAMWLYFSVTQTPAEDAALPFGLPLEDAMVLMRTFMIVGAVGLAAAILAAAVTSIVGGADNAKLRQRGEELGEAIATASKEFDDDLDRFRRDMDARGDPADAVVDLSRAHLTALEAQAFFRELAFLFDADNENAGVEFRGFLRSHAPPSKREPAGLVFLVGLVVGAALAYAQVRLGGAPAAEAGEAAGDSVPLAIAQYPWALAALALGGVLFAAAGLIAAFIAQFFASAAAGGVDEALDALRSEFTAREAPRPVDVIRRIEDALAVFRARVGRLTERDRRANRSADETAAEMADEPAWRKRDTSVRFVDAGFQAAPKTWRADPHVKIGDGETAPKRRFFGLKRGDGN